MTTYQDEETILKYVRHAHERVKTKHWIDVKENMLKALDLIDKL